MVFSQHVRAYKISIKFVKNVGTEVMSLGFPVSEVEKGNLSLEFILEKIRAKYFELGGDDVIFILDKAGVKSNYNKWTETLKQEMPIGCTAGVFDR